MLVMGRMIARILVMSWVVLFGMGAGAAADSRNTATKRMSSQIPATRNNPVLFLIRRYYGWVAERSIEIRPRESVYCSSMNHQGAGYG